MELEKKMKNVWMGSFKLFISLARFSVENGEAWENLGNINALGKEKMKSQCNKEQKIQEDKRFNSSVSSSFSYVGAVSGFRQKQINVEKCKEVVVSDFVKAFEDFHDKAIVGRVKDLWKLRKLSVLMKEADFRDLEIKYLGGMYVLIAFKSLEADLFRANASNFGWFLNLDLWRGQVVAFERIAWLNIHRVLLHLSNNEVFDSVGRCFGTVIHASQMQTEVYNLTSDCVGVLTDSVKRIEEEVVLIKDGERFKVLVEEEREVWVPDSVENLNIHIVDEDGWDLVSNKENSRGSRSAGEGIVAEVQASGTSENMADGGGKNSTRDNEVSELAMVAEDSGKELRDRGSDSGEEI
ncbi:hypothetical protein HanXRQr2_Chr13g0569311 [Helianthus annuus]|uniref:DUF4283 domain-containing protein n=1 Tax=Helianthus annuus TaxID=4232 RepID=A0A9K3EGC2_HELAN|nr:hypothetical protein HanXRQr2_Chr13g0569311 [Helianthus annuus]KAJ0496336.1 hypothetical protein HanHA89_Chr13g0498521 [Helianthus annuus]